MPPAGDCCWSASRASSRLSAEEFRVVFLLPNKNIDQRFVGAPPFVQLFPSSIRARAAERVLPPPPSAPFDLSVHMLDLFLLSPSPGGHLAGLR